MSGKGIPKFGKPAARSVSVERNPAVKDMIKNMENRVREQTKTVVGNAKVIFHPSGSEESKTPTVQTAPVQENKDPNTARFDTLIALMTQQSQALNSHIIKHDNDIEALHEENKEIRGELQLNKENAKRIKENHQDIVDLVVKVTDLSEKVEEIEVKSKLWKKNSRRTRQNTINRIPIS